MKEYSYSIKHLTLLSFFGLILFSSCNKDYYQDGGVSNPKFNGSILEYLKTKPLYFDTLTEVINIAGLEDDFQNRNMTFFAPTDRSFKSTLRTVNSRLYNAGKDTLKTLTDIDPQIWRKYLTQYLFNGSNLSKDYPQLDVRNRGSFPGQNYRALNDVTMNIGLVYADAGSSDEGIIKYGGPRSLLISFIPNTALPLNNWNSTRITSSDIQPTNGVVHVIEGGHSFSFDVDNFYIDIFLTR